MIIALCAVVGLTALSVSATELSGELAEAAISGGADVGPLGCPSDREDVPDSRGKVAHPTPLPPHRTPSEVIVCFYGIPGRPTPALTGSGSTEQRQLISHLVGSFNRLPASRSGVLRCPRGDNRAEFVCFRYADGDVVRVVSHPTGCRLVGSTWSRSGFTMTLGVLGELERVVGGSGR
jgi:hypothetical protein